ncbi:hypothetical protein [Dyadobacter sp. Leaf189]|uniref:hypothetical protein n=1 Tax=Dyadobacter sp. Leaf189 TaxID=1736295 RepID=UPI0006F394A5|nr:hypothetical protein [Dyadobacter sp. Leaf189]KQS33395.1 hypothetical protein ASG33_04770 [Dyadobacter sp. Leaf189]
MNQRFKSSLHIVKGLLFTAAFSLLIFSCRTAEVAVNNQLKTDTETYQVKGRQGFQIGQVLSFGDYKTSKVKRGWTFSYSLPFIVKFNGAREKISFQQFGLNGTTADVALVSRFKESEYAPLEDYFSISLKYKNYFAGTVKIAESSESWDFLVHNVDGASRSLSKNSTVGFVRSNHIKIEIEGIRELEGSTSFLTQNDVYGYQFTWDGKVVAAVSTINNGKVWFKKELDPNLKLVLASVSSGLMLRNNMDDNTISMH